MKKIIFLVSLIPCFAVLNESESFLPNAFGVLWIAILYLFYKYSKKGRKIIKEIK